VLQWREAGRLSQDAATQQLVRTRAAEFGRALLAYKHTDLNGSRTRIQRLASTDFGKSYEAAFSGLSDVIGKYKADATATVRDTYVNEIDGDRAKALVVLDSEVRSTAGTRRVLGTKLLLELIREKGQWRVSAMTSLEADDETQTKPDGTPASPRPSGGGSGAPAPPPGTTP
jgi:Mce-associated membrane protein